MMRVDLKMNINEIIIFDEKDNICWNKINLCSIAGLDLWNDQCIENVNIWDIAAPQQLIIRYQMHGDNEIDEFINIFNNDVELKKLNFTYAAIKQQQLIANKDYL